MKCPECGKEIKTVEIISGAAQLCLVDENGEIYDFGDINLDAFDIDEVRHLDNGCNADVKEVINV